MAYQEVTTTGYGTRVGNSFRGIGMGFLLFIGATALLWWNEGRAVKTDKMLNEAQKVCVDMENPSKIDPALDGEVVCATAMATTEDSLTDQQFALGAKAISLVRKVEYFQWVEHATSKSEDKFGGKEVTTTTYTYSKEWVDRPIDSGQFHDPAYQGKNRVVATYDSQVQWAENVSFGAYKLNESQIHSISSYEPVVLNIDNNSLVDINKSVAAVYGKDSKKQAPAAEQAPAAANDSTAVVVPDSVPQENKVDLEFVHQAGNVLFLGQTAAAPEVGDVRITFEKVVPAKITIISQVTGNTFKPYKAKNGKKFQTLRMGKYDSDEIFDSEHEANHMFTWVFRLVGALLVIMGLKMMFGILETLLKVVPFLSSIMGWGIGVVCTVVGIVWSLIIIALAWLFYRPLIGVTLLVLAAFIIWVFAFKGKDKLKELAANARKRDNGVPAVK